MENQPNTNVWTDEFLKPTTMDAMLTLLATSNVDVSTWGGGSAKM
jgi:RNA-binding protein YlmH